MGTVINPVTPTYSKAKPPTNENCVGCGAGANQTFYMSSGAEGKDVEMLDGNQISVTDTSTSEIWRFQHDYVPVQPLGVTLSLTAKASSATKTMPILKGTIIDEINLSWIYSPNAISSQTLTNDGGLTPPTLSNADRSHDYTSQSITSDVEFTVDGDDGLGNGGDSTASDSESVTFGNYIRWGENVSLLGQANAQVQALFNTLSNEAVATNYTRSVYATGGTNEKFFVMYPKAWGIATFKKGIFEGGMMRLKKSQSSGTLVSELSQGDSEVDISLPNGNGYSENYYVFESRFDNQADATEPIQIF